MTQALAMGQTVAEKYDRLGFTDVSIVPAPTSVTMLLIGDPNTGKSNLLQSCPNCLVFNTDLSSTVTKGNIQATMVPIVDEEGRPVIIDVETGEKRAEPLTWDIVHDRKKLLIEMAEAGYVQRPRMVALDSLTAALPLVIQWVTRYAQDLGISNREVTMFKDLHGPAAWDAVYTELTSFVRDLHSAGYGVCLTAHLTNKVIPLGENQAKTEVGLSGITDNFFSRLYPTFQMVAGTEVYNDTEEFQPPVQKLKDGTSFHPPKQTRSVQRYSILIDSKDRSDLRHLLKRRIKLNGRVILPESNTWAAWEQAYTQAATAA